MRFDRYGDEKGFFLGKPGEGWEKRSLPPYTKKANYQAYETTDAFPRDVRILEGEIAEWFGQKGGGTQYLVVKEEYSSLSVEEIIKSGIEDEDLFYSIKEMRQKEWIKEVNN